MGRQDLKLGWEEGRGGEERRVFAGGLGLGEWGYGGFMGFGIGEIYFELLVILKVCHLNIHFNCFINS